LTKTQWGGEGRVQRARDHKKKPRFPASMQGYVYETPQSRARVEKARRTRKKKGTLDTLAKAPMWINRSHEEGNKDHWAGGAFKKIIPRTWEARRGKGGVKGEVKFVSALRSGRHRKETCIPAQWRVP